MPVRYPNPPVEHCPAYISSRHEAYREAAFTGCSVTLWKVQVGDRVVIEKGVGNRCRACGGVHLQLDLFDSQEQVTKALQDSQCNIPQFVRDEDGHVRYTLGNPTEGATIKSIFGCDVDAAVGAPPYHYAVITKDVGNDDPRIITKG